MIIGELAKALGAGMKVYAATVSVADGGTVDTGFKVIYGAVATSTNADHVVAITGINGGTLTIGIHDNAGNAISSAEDVYIVAFGQ